MVSKLRFSFLTFLASSAVGACASDPPISVRKHCVSDSGQSEYFVALDIAKGTGVLRYKYFGQDVSYVVKSLTAERGLMIGTAYFDASASGEVRGSPVEFEYDWSRDTFVDGAVKFKCTNLQDDKLLKTRVLATPPQQR